MDKFKDISRAKFEAMITEERKTLASFGDDRSYTTGYFDLRLDGGKGAKLGIIPVEDVFGVLHRDFSRC